jgi:DNA-binding response OmpR family regulator
MPVPGASTPPPSERGWELDGPSSQRGGAASRAAPEISTLAPLVLLVKHGEVEESALCQMVRAAGYTLLLRQDALSAYQAAKQSMPDVIVVDSDLNQESGDSFVRRIRSDPSKLAATPLMLLTTPADTRTRVARFATGADVCIMKPYRMGDVVAQVAALVKMSTRLRSAREALPYISSTGDKVFQGDIQHISIAAMLTILEMERRSGVFDVHSEGRRAQIELVAGRVTTGVALDRQVGPLDALRTALRWTKGHFSFRSIPLRAPPPDAKTITELLGEALRMQDEEDHPEALAPGKA